MNQAGVDLDVFTNRDAMRALLQSQMPGYAEGRLRIDALDFSEARQNTSIARNPCRMTLCYQLQVSELAVHRSGTQRLYAQVHRDSVSAASALAQHEASPLVAPAFGEALVHLPALNLLLWAWPNDPGLPQLPALLDPKLALRALPIAMTGAFEVELLRYVPKHRATLRYTVDAGAGRAPITLYAKTFRDDRAALIAQRFEHFWSLAQRDDAAPSVAQPLGHDPTTHTFWQASAAGLPLAHALSSANTRAWLGQVARALALLHSAPLAPALDATPRSVSHWIREVRRREEKLKRVDAALSARATRIADAIQTLARHQEARSFSLIHGDFHPDQIWIHEGRVVLFDFDEFTLGDPMEDVAEFVLKLCAAGAAPAQADAFVAAYAHAAPERFNKRSLDWHVAIQRLLQACRAFIYQQPDWRRVLEQRLADCESHLATLT
jgi:hypothetical protein